MPGPSDNSAFNVVVVILLCLYAAFSLFCLLFWITALYDYSKQQWPRAASNRGHKLLVILGLALVTLLSPVIVLVYLLFWLGVFLWLCLLFLGMSLSMLTNCLCGCKLPCHPARDGYDGLRFSLCQRLDQVRLLQYRVLHPGRLDPDATSLSPGMITSQSRLSSVLAVSNTPLAYNYATKDPSPPRYPGV